MMTTSRPATTITTTRWMRTRARPRSLAPPVWYEPTLHALRSTPRVPPGVPANALPWKRTCPPWSDHGLGIGHRACDGLLTCGDGSGGPSAWCVRRGLTMELGGFHAYAVTKSI